MVSTHSIARSELAEVVAFVARLQADPAHYIGYLDTDIDALTEQLSSLEPLGLDGVIAATRDGRLVGVLGVDWDTDPARVWWHGPLVDDGEDWDATADALYEHAGALLPPGGLEQELFVDARNERIGAFARRHGFDRERSSAILTRPLDQLPSIREVEGMTVRALTDADRNAVAALHQQLFAGAHRSGTRLDEGDQRFVLVATQDDELVGYLAAERQEDGQGYLDFLGVPSTARGRGVGERLIAEVCHRLRDAGSDRVHLTVREDNHDARRLYGRLGFEHERIGVPWRRPRRVR